MTAAQLKASILQLAVSGKLVPQDPKDEPASVLLERIQAEKAKLVKDGKIKKEKPQAPVGDDEVPFELPSGWEWCRLGSVVYNHGQKTPDGDFCYIDIGSIDNIHQQLSETDNVMSPADASSRARKIVKRGDVIYSCVRPYLHNIAIIDREFSLEPIASTGFAVMATCEGVCNKYLFYYLLSPWFDEYANDGENAKGIAYPAISDSKLYAALMPLPPLAEQHRIVAKVDELLPLVDRYAALEDKRLKLEADLPGALRKSILQQAIEGKLTDRDPKDEPASELLKRIADDKAKLIKEGKLKKEKPLPPIADEEKPFDLPEGWEWCRFGAVSTLVSGRDLEPHQYNDARQGMIYVTGPSCLSDNGVLEKRWTPEPCVFAERGDVLLVCKGSGYGKTVICDKDKVHIARQIMSVKSSDYLDMGYAQLFLDSRFEYIKKSGQGVIPGIERSVVLMQLFPLPPLAEQHRIVAKVEALLADIDRLKK